MCLQSIFKIEDIEVFKEELTKYCLNMLVGFESAYQTCLEVMIENGINDTKDVYGVNVYEEMYVPYYEKKQCIQKEIKVREGEIEQVYFRKRNEDRIRKSLSDKLNFQKFLGDELWSIFCLYLREDTYSNKNYISDGLSNSELVKRAVELVDAAKEEAKRACENQITLTISLSNMLLDDNLLQFLKNEPKIGDWLMVSVDNMLYKLRLIAIEANYDNFQDIKFTFSNVIKAKNVLTDAKDLLSKAKSIAGSFDYVAHQASQGSDLKLEMNEYREEGIAGEEIKIYNDKNQQVLVDEHGISCRQYDDITEDYSPKQMRIINNVLAFTKDNWQTVDTAIGEIQYSLGDEIFYDYGVKANTIVSGKFIGGDIYSSNYKIKTNPITGEEYVYGSHIGLNDGSFEIGDGSLTYNKSNGLDIKANLSFLGSLYTYQRQIAFDDSGEPYYIPTDNFEVMGYSEIDDSIHFRDSEGNYLFYSNQNEFAINKNAKLRFSGNLMVDKPDGGINNVDIGTTSLDDIGDGTITGAIQSCFQSVSNGKALIADAITGKGVSTSATDTFEVMANNISAIETGGISDSNIKCIIGNGHGYFNTGIIFDSETSIEIKFNYIHYYDSKNWIFGIGNTGQQIGFSQLRQNKMNLLSIHHGSIMSLSGIEPDDRLPSDLHYIIDFKNKIITDVINKSTYDIGLMDEINYQIPIFALNNGTSFEHPSSDGFGLYNFKIYKNNNIIKDYIPAKDGNGIVCLYDKISKTYLYDATGTNSFGCISESGDNNVGIEVLLDEDLTFKPGHSVFCSDGTVFTCDESTGYYIADKPIRVDVAEFDVENSAWERTVILWGGDPTGGTKWECWLTGTNQLAYRLDSTRYPSSGTYTTNWLQEGKITFEFGKAYVGTGDSTDNVISYYSYDKLQINSLGGRTGVGTPPFEFKHIKLYRYKKS